MNELPKYQLSIRVAIQDTMTGGGLQVSEDFRVGTQNFIEICQMLGRFHELSEKIRKEQAE